MKKGQKIDQLLTQREPVIMGILNVTSDSFADGGKFDDHDAALAHARTMIVDGADIVDLGAESTRPGAAPVDAEQEIQKLVPLIEEISAETDVPLSVDTSKPEVAQKCLEAGAAMINDVTGLQNQAMVDVVAKAQCPVVIMHMQGSPRTMQDNPHYDDVVSDIKKFFETQIATAEAAGVEKIILDPGIGFGKNLEHNLTLVKNLEAFSDLGYPLLLGASRKSFIKKITGEPVEERLAATIAANTLGFANGAHIFRVHDVKEHKSALTVAHNTINI